MAAIGGVKLTQNTTNQSAKAEAPEQIVEDIVKSDTAAGGGANA